jgi:ABC-2 type transport system permease protein
MQWISHVIAPSYVFEGMRAIVSGHSAPLTDLAWSAGLDLASILFAAWLFRRVYRHAVKTGLIARYSAESLS